MSLKVLLFSLSSKSELQHTPNRLKKQAKLLDHNCNHQQGFVKRNTVALNHCGFKSKSLKYFHKIPILGKFYEYNRLMVVTQNWN